MIVIKLMSRIDSTFIFETKHAIWKAGKKELICLLWIYFAFGVSVIKSFLFLLVLRIGCVFNCGTPFLNT